MCFGFEGLSVEAVWVSMSLEKDETAFADGWLSAAQHKTLPCHEISASSTEYQPTAYTPHVIADMKMRPHLKVHGCGHWVRRFTEIPRWTFRVAENDAATDNDRKRYEQRERILRIGAPHPTRQQQEYPKQGTNSPP